MVLAMAWLASYSPTCRCSDEAAHAAAHVSEEEAMRRLREKSYQYQRFVRGVRAGGGDGGAC